MDQPRASVRPRYARIVAATSAALVTLTAVVASLAGDEVSGGDPDTTGARPRGDVALLAGSPAGRAVTDRGVPTSLPASPSPTPTTPAPARPAVPGSSGEGRRVVFSEVAQRVWLVRADGSVARTYLVSGSVTDNLHPGTYEVYSRSERAWGIDDSGTMRYMVRFTHGENAAIGFHDIPVKDGERVQTRAQLGEPRSHGCIRQWRPDARALWDFAPVGARVDVVA